MVGLMSVNKIESLVDAIGRLNSINNPDSLAYQIRNPLLLVSFAKPGRHDVNEDGLRVFSSLLAGYKAATYDVLLKIKGLSRAGLKPTDALDNLLGCYRIAEKAAKDNVLSFVKRALKDDSLTLRTPLSYFLE